MKQGESPQSKRHYTALFLLLMPLFFIVIWIRYYLVVFFNLIQREVSFGFVLSLSGRILLISACLSLITTFLFYLLRELVSVTWHIQFRSHLLHFNLRTVLIILITVLCLIPSVKGFMHWHKLHPIMQGINRVQASLASDGFIMHACGKITDENGKVHTRTNSYEAFMHCIENDHRFIELDMLPTSDQKLACLHGWKRWYDRNGIKGSGQVTTEEFLAGSIAGQFTPMSMDDVAAIMREHPEVYIITDMKKSAVIPNCQILARLYPDLKDRFIVQIYHADEYEAIYEMGFHNIIYTLYRATSEERSAAELKTFCSSHLLVGLTLHRKWFSDEAYFNAVWEIGTPLYIHTIDDQEKMLRMFANGVDAIYTNEIFNRGDFS